MSTTHPGLCQSTGLPRVIVAREAFEWRGAGGADTPVLMISMPDDDGYERDCHLAFAANLPCAPAGRLEHS